MASNATAPEVTIAVPILNRPERIPRVAQAFNDPRFQLLFLPDPEDAASLAALREFGLLHSVSHITERWGRRTYAAKINHAFSTTTTPFFLYASDDVEPEVGWWDAAHAALADERVGLLATDDKMNYQVSCGRLATHGILRREYVESFGSASLPDAGPVFWEGYGHWCVDAEASYVARLRDAFLFEPRSVIRHARADSDPTYVLGGSTRYEDRANLRQRCPAWPRVPGKIDIPGTPPA